MKRTQWIVTLIIIVVSMLLPTACGSGIFSNQSAGDAAQVTNVEVIQTGGNYFAIVTGQLPDSCTKIGRTTQQVVGKTIKITMNTHRPDEAVCTTAMQPFKERVRLDVKELSAGQYSVDVNGVTTNFNLTENY